MPGPRQNRPLLPAELQDESRDWYDRVRLLEKAAARAKKERDTLSTGRSLVTGRDEWRANAFLIFLCFCVGICGTSVSVTTSFLMTVPSYLDNTPLYLSLSFVGGLFWIPVVTFQLAIGAAASSSLLEGMDGIAKRMRGLAIIGILQGFFHVIGTVGHRGLGFAYFFQSLFYGWGSSDVETVECLKTDPASKQSCELIPYCIYFEDAGRCMVNTAEKVVAFFATVASPYPLATFSWKIALCALIPCIVVFLLHSRGAGGITNIAPIISMFPFIWFFLFIFFQYVCHTAFFSDGHGVGLESRVSEPSVTTLQDAIVRGMIEGQTSAAGMQSKTSEAFGSAMSTSSPAIHQVWQTLIDFTLMTYVTHIYSSLFVYYYIGTNYCARARTNVLLAGIITFVGSWLAQGVLFIFMQSSARFIYTVVKDANIPTGSGALEYVQLRMWNLMLQKKDGEIPTDTLTYFWHPIHSIIPLTFTLDATARFFAICFYFWYVIAQIFGDWCTLLPIIQTLFYSRMLSTRSLYMHHYAITVPHDFAAQKSRSQVLSPRQRQLLSSSPFYSSFASSSTSSVPSPFSAKSPLSPPSPKPLGEEGHPRENKRILSLDTNTVRFDTSEVDGVPRGETCDAFTIAEERYLGKDENEEGTDQIDRNDENCRESQRARDSTGGKEDGRGNMKGTATEEQRWKGQNRHEQIRGPRGEGVDSVERVYDVATQDSDGAKESGHVNAAPRTTDENPLKISVRLTEEASHGLSPRSSPSFDDDDQDQSDGHLSLSDTVKNDFNQMEIDLSSQCRLMRTDQSEPHCPFEDDLGSTRHVEVDAVDNVPPHRSTPSVGVSNDHSGEISSLSPSMPVGCSTLSTSDFDSLPPTLSALCLNQHSLFLPPPDRLRQLRSTSAISYPTGYKKDGESTMVCQQREIQVQILHEMVQPISIAEGNHQESVTLSVSTARDTSSGLPPAPTSPLPNQSIKSTRRLESHPLQRVDDPPLLSLPGREMTSSFFSDESNQSLMLTGDGNANSSMNENKVGQKHLSLAEDLGRMGSGLAEVVGFRRSDWLTGVIRRDSRMSYSQGDMMFENEGESRSDLRPNHFLNGMEKEKRYRRKWEVSQRSQNDGSMAGYGVEEFGGKGFGYRQNDRPNDSIERTGDSASICNSRRGLRGWLSLRGTRSFKKLLTGKSRKNVILGNDSGMESAYCPVESSSNVGGVNYHHDSYNRADLSGLSSSSLSSPRVASATYDDPADSRFYEQPATNILPFNTEFITFGRRKKESHRQWTGCPRPFCKSFRRKMSRKTKGHAGAGAGTGEHGGAEEDYDGGSKSDAFTSKEYVDGIETKQVDDSEDSESEIEAEALKKIHDQTPLSKGDAIRTGLFPFLEEPSIRIDSHHAQPHSRCNTCRWKVTKVFQSNLTETHRRTQRLYQWEIALVVVAIAYFVSIFFLLAPTDTYHPSALKFSCSRYFIDCIGFFADTFLIIELHYIAWLLGSREQSSHVGLYSVACLLITWNVCSAMLGIAVFFEMGVVAFSTVFGVLFLGNIVAIILCKTSYEHVEVHHSVLPIPHPHLETLKQRQNIHHCDGSRDTNDIPLVHGRASHKTASKPKGIRVLATLKRGTTLSEMKVKFRKRYGMRSSESINGNNLDHGEKSGVGSGTPRRQSVKVSTTNQLELPSNSVRFNRKRRSVSYQGKGMLDELGDEKEFNGVATSRGGSSAGHELQREEETRTLNSEANASKGWNIGTTLKDDNLLGRQSFAGMASAFKSSRLSLSSNLGSTDRVPRLTLAKTILSNVNEAQRTEEGLVADSGREESVEIDRGGTRSTGHLLRPETIYHVEKRYRSMEEESPFIGQSILSSQLPLSPIEGCDAKLSPRSRAVLQKFLMDKRVQKKKNRLIYDPRLGKRHHQKDRRDGRGDSESPPMEGGRRLYHSAQMAASHMWGKVVEEGGLSARNERQGDAMKAGERQMGDQRVPQMITTARFTLRQQQLITVTRKIRLSERLWWLFFGNLELTRTSLNIAVTGQSDRHIPFLITFALKFLTCPVLLMSIVTQWCQVSAILSPIGLMLSRTLFTTSAAVVLLFVWTICIPIIILAGIVRPAIFTPFTSHIRWSLPLCWMPSRRLADFKKNNCVINFLYELFPSSWFNSDLAEERGSSMGSSSFSSSASSITPSITSSTVAQTIKGKSRARCVYSCRNFLSKSR